MLVFSTGKFLGTQMHIGSFRTAPSSVKVLMLQRWLLDQMLLVNQLAAMPLEVLPAFQDLDFHMIQKHSSRQHLSTTNGSTQVSATSNVSPGLFPSKYPSLAFANCYHDITATIGSLRSSNISKYADAFS